MSDDNLNDDKQAEMMATFVEKMTPKLAETVLEQIGAKVDERLNGIAAKNNELLAKLHKSKESNTSLETQMAELTKQLSGENKLTEIVLSKADARDVRKYQAAKKQAEEAGIPLQIDRGA